MSTTPRRSVIRPATRPVPGLQRLSKLRSKLEREQQFLERWMVRLKRAFHSFEKYQSRVSRLEREIRALESS